MGLFNKSKTSAVAVVSKREQYNLTESVKVADVKQYLLDEYDRAATRERKIGTLENKIIELEEIRIKYEAMLVVGDKTRDRLLKSEQDVETLKSNAAELRETIKTLKNTNNNIELNYVKKLKEKDAQIKELKQAVKPAPRKAKK